MLAVFYLNMNSSSGTTISDDGYDCPALVEMMQAPEAITMQSDLRFLVLIEGEGRSPQATSTVTVNYRGCLPDGTELDSSYSRGQPATFRLNELIVGWTKSVQLMNSGASYVFYIPSELAYGEAGRSGTIPPNTPLIFEITLLGFQ
jgi:FKBP-type peptidyl-prolyl cis-trans isomerase